MPIPDNIIEKAKKLLAFKEDAERRNSVAEAENVAQRIQELLIKYNLSMGDVQYSETGKPVVQKNTISSDEFDYEKRHGKWLERLLGGICRNNLCAFIITRKKVYSPGEGWVPGNPLFHIVGRSENVEIVKFLFEQLIIKGKEAEKEAWRSYRGKEKHGMFRRGFLEGFALGIGAKLEEQLHKMVEEDVKVTALVKVNDQAVDDFIQKEWPRLGHSRKSGNNSEALMEGFIAGKNTEINKGVKAHEPLVKLHG